MTIILGPLPCRECRRPVTVVRRTVEVPCCEYLTPTHGPDAGEWHMVAKEDHTHTLHDIGPMTAVDADGERHGCLT